MSTENLAVVLVEPQGARNIGSVSRAMLNFSVTDLRLINPQTDHLGHAARQMAVKSTPVLENARVYSTLAEALADSTFSIGTTRRFGRYREDLLHPDEAASKLLPLTDQGDRVALVFGREDKGLTTAELDLCQQCLTIPSNADLPSLNLAQAVVVCLYEFQRIRGEQTGCSHGRKKLAANAELEALYQHMRRSLVAIDYLDAQNPDHILRSFRRIFGRAGLNSREVRILRGLFNQIDISSGNKSQRN